VFEMRRIIELAVVERLATGPGAKRLKGVAALIDKERKAFERHDFAAWIRLSGEFHTALAALTGNATLCECLDGLVARSTLMSALYESHGRSPCSCDDHDEILSALEAGDPKRAVTLMAHHLQHVELKMLDRPAQGQVDLREVFGGA